MSVTSGSEMTSGVMASDESVTIMESIFGSDNKGESRLAPTVGENILVVLKFAVNNRKKYIRGGTNNRVKATWERLLAVMRLAPKKVPMMRML